MSPAVPDHDDSLFARFSSAHLPTSAERSLFSALASSRDRVWTVARAARAALVSDHEADMALRRFGAAGIVERLDAPGHPRHYRWRPEMAYLRDGPDPSGQLDPVCGMPVPADSPHVADQDGQQVRFCSLPCLVRWRAEHRPRPGLTL